MNEQQLQQQIVQLVQAAMQGDQQATQQIQQIMQAAQQGNQQAAQIAQMIQQVARQMQQQQVQAARFGAKLNYIRQLKGQCPEGYKMEYYKEGGQLCKKCMKVQQNGGDVKQAPNTVAGQFKMEAAKCGKKMKKKEEGGTIESEKCGGKPKLKKRACGGSMNKKINKRLLGGKQRQPFTGFEGLSYHEEGPYVPSSGAQSRAERPLIEEVRNQNGLVMGRETWSDPQETGYYNANSGADLEWEPNETQVRTFNSLKRHALMNQQLGSPRFKNGGKAKKKN